MTRISVSRDVVVVVDVVLERKTSYKLSLCRSACVMFVIPGMRLIVYVMVVFRCLLASLY